MVSRSVLAKAKRLIRFRRAHFFKQLMMRTLTWAGGFARIENEDVLCEVAGRESWPWPTFAYQQAALREAIRIQSIPVWIEDAPLTTTLCAVLVGGLTLLAPFCTGATLQAVFGRFS